MIYYILYGLIWLFTLLPNRILYGISSFFGFCLFWIIRYRKRLIIKNLKKSFPDKSNAEILLIAKKFNYHLADTFMESLMVIHMSKKEANQRLKIKNINVLDKFYESGKSVISVFGHYGTWDLFNILPVHTNFEVAALYKPIHNKAIDKLLMKIREKFGVITVPSNQALPTILKNKNINKPMIYLFVADQAPLRRDIRYWTTFLNQETPVFIGPEKIAKKTGFPVVFFDVQKVKRGFYEVEIKVITEEPSELPEFEITEKHVRILEERIINKPEYWLWSHNRWKHEKFY